MMSSLDLVMAAFRTWAPVLVVDLVQSLSFLVHYDAIVRGVIDLRDLIFYLSIMGVFLLANVVVVDLKKGV
jgi:ABC-2 type transport system permease protein